ncbi:MAG: hypothetical protein V1773_11950 [bacterium]
MLIYIFAALLLIHGIAHLVGFIVPWKIADLKDMPYSTKIFNKKIELGEVGIKIYGLIWLFLAVFFLVCVILIIYNGPIHKNIIISASVLSLFMSVLGIPDSKFGIVINVLIIVYLFI